MRPAHQKPTIEYHVPHSLHGQRVDLYDIGYDKPRQSLRIAAGTSVRRTATLPGSAVPGPADQWGP